MLQNYRMVKVALFKGDIEQRLKENERVSHVDLRVSRFQIEEQLGPRAKVLKQEND